MDDEQELRRRADELSALHTISLNISATRDLPTLLKVIVEQAAQLLHASAGSLYLSDPDQQIVRCAVCSGTRRDYAGTVLKYGEGLSGLVAQTGEPLIIDDYRGWPNRAKVFEDEQPFRGVLCVPLTWQGQVTGAMQVLHFDEGRHFTQSEMELLRLIANQAAIAVENTRLLDAERSQLLLFQTLLEVGALLTSQLGLKDVLESILDLLHRVIQYDSVSIQLVGPDGFLRLAAGRGFPDLNLASQVVEKLSGYMHESKWKTKEVVVIPDTYHHPLWRVEPGTEYIRSWIGTPLLVKGEFIGALNLDSRTVNAFDESISETVMAFAHQAAIAIENARLFEAERTARQRSDALRLAAAAIGTSLSLEQVLRTVLDQLGRVLNYDSGSIMLVEKEEVKIRIWSGHDRFTSADRIHEIHFDRLTDSTVGWVVRNRKALSIKDTAQDPRWKVTDWSKHIGSWLGVPLFSRDRVIGIFSLDRVTKAGFAEEEISLVEMFAAHAAAAIENARLFEAEGQRAFELEALRRASLSLTASLELPQVLNAVLKSTLDLAPDAHNSHIFLYDENEQRLSFGASLWSDGTKNQVWGEPRPNGLTYTVIRIGEPIVVSDMSDHSLFAGTGWIGAIIGLPLKIGKRVVGVMNVNYEQPRQFSEPELRIIRLLGDQAAIGIENARLFEQAATERRHLSLLYDISRGLSTSLDPDEILNHAIQLTCRALGGIVGQAFLYEPGEMRLNLRALARNTTSTPIKLGGNISFLLGEGLAGWTGYSLQAVLIPELNDDPRWINLSGDYDYAHSAISAPILSESQLLGVLTLLHHEPSAFTQHHLNLLQAICQELALALSNAFRYQQVKRRLAEITLIQDLTQTFTQRLELNALLEEIVERLANEAGYPRVEIFLKDGDELYQVSYRGLPTRLQPIQMTQGIIGKAARTGEAILVPDVTKDQDFIPDNRATVAELATPIFRANSIFGVINIETDQPNQLTGQDRDLLKLLGGQISIALDNVLLFERVHQHADQLEKMVTQRTAELAELYELSQEIGYELTYNGLLALLLRHVRKAVGSSWAMGCLNAYDQRVIFVQTSRPVSPAVLTQLQSLWAEVLENQAAQQVNLTDIAVKIIPAEDYDKNAEPIQNIVTLIQEEVFINLALGGILVVGSDQPDFFGAEQKRLLTTFANQATAAIQRLEVVLAAQQRNLESLVDHMPVGTLLFDREFNLLVANPIGREFLKKLNKDDIQDKLERFGPFSLPELIAHQSDVIPLEITIEGPPRRFFDAQVRPVGNENQQWVITVRDTTQERENQIRIQNQERLAVVGQLAAGIAHDFNNIMAAILVYTDLLRSDPSLQVSNRERLNIVQQQVQRASSLIRQILDFSRRSVMEQSSLDLLPFIKELDSLLGRILPETIRLELTYQPGSYWVHADPTRLQQVFMNLALNSRDAMVNGGMLRFELNRLHINPDENPPLPDMPPGDWIKIIIADSGIGISPEVLRHIFEPFFTTKPVGQGTGLGLAQVYGIIRQHEGYIDVFSELDKGTSFTIYLPALLASQEWTPSSEVPIHYSGNQEPILLVEDDEATRIALRTLLEELNFKVFTASNGAEALHVYHQTSEPLQLVISDLIMPQLGGVALYHALHRENPKIKILFITGHPMDDENQALLENGSIHWLQKPFSIQELTQTMRLLIEEPHGSIDNTFRPSY